MSAFIDFLKTLFKTKPLPDPEVVYRKLYIEKHGHDLRCHHCDKWQSSALNIDQPIECEAVPDQPLCFVLVCAACHERTTFFDTGFMGACVAVDSEAALRGDYIPLPSKTEFPCASKSASPP